MASVARRKSTPSKVILCEDVLFFVLRSIEKGKDLARLCCVSKYLQAVGAEDVLWKPLCATRWPNSVSSPEVERLIIAAGGYKKFFSSRVCRKWGKGRKALKSQTVFPPRILLTTDLPEGSKHCQMSARMDNYAFFVDITHMGKSVMSKVICGSAFHSRGQFPKCVARATHTTAAGMDGGFLSWFIPDLAACPDLVISSTTPRIETLCDGILCHLLEVGISFSCCVLRKSDNKYATIVAEKDFLGQCFNVADREEEWELVYPEHICMKRQMPTIKPENLGKRRRVHSGPARWLLFEVVIRVSSEESRERRSLNEDNLPPDIKLKLKEVEMAFRFPGVHNPANRNCAVPDTDKLALDLMESLTWR